MRKIDYKILAAIIRRMLECGTYDAPTLRQTALNFANQASVDRALFLKECGL